MFIGRFLSISAESNGELSKAEVSAFESYRTHRLEPRIRTFFKYSDGKNYGIFTNGYTNPPFEADVVLSVINDLVEKFKSKKMTGIEREISEETEKLLQGKYFLYKPENLKLRSLIGLRLPYFLRKENEKR